jgi:nitrite reductase (NADH) small subunit
MSDWTDVGPLEDFPDGSVRPVQLGRREACVVRLGDDVFAFLNLCPHAGAKLCAGRVVPVLEGEAGHPRVDIKRRVVACPWHGWEFEPESGKSLADPEMRMRTWPARTTTAGRIEIDA